MFTVTLKDGGAFDLPPESILLLEESEDGKKGCTIVYSLIPGQNTVDELKDAYGFVKKLWSDAVHGMIEISEVTIAKEKGGKKMSYHTTMVVARRELTDGTNGAKTRLTLNVNGAVIGVDVLDSRDSLNTGE